MSVFEGPIAPFLVTAERGYATLASLNADLTPNAFTGAAVRADPTDTNNGYYQKTGASGLGGWTKIADIPVLDVPTITAVAGTANAITGTASKVPADGQSYYLVPTATNTGTVTLALNAGIARSVRNADGTQLSEGQLVSGRRYMLVFDGSVSVYRALGIVSAPAAYGTMTLVGASGRFIDFRTVSTNAAANSRIFFNSDGSVDIYAGGAGVSAAPIALRFQTDGATRAFGRILNSRAREVYSADNPAPATDDNREFVAQLLGPWWEGPAAAVVVSTTPPFSIGGAHLGKRIRVTATGAWIDFDPMPLNTEIVIDCQNACTFYAGYSGFTWRSLGGTRLSVSAGSMVRVLKGQSDLVAEVIVGSAIAATPAIPVYSRKACVTLSQSWGVRVSTNGVPGMQDMLSSISLGRDVLSIQNASFGASAISRYAPTDVNNYWWDRTANAGAGGPGPNLTAAIAAINAAPGSPTLTDIVVMIGLNDLSIMAASGAYPTFNTIAGWKSDFLAALAHLRTQLSLPTLRAWICPLPAQDLGTFSEAAFTAMRRGQLDLIAEGTNIFRGPDYYDLPRPYNDRHHPFQAQSDFGSRIMRFITNTTDAKTNWKGPRISAFSRTAANTYQVTIDLDNGVVGGGAALNRPVVPDGFAIMPGGDLWATPLTVAPGGYTWSGNNLIITTTTDDVAATLAYPYGSAGMTAPSRMVWAVDAVSAIRMPLMTYHPTA